MERDELFKKHEALIYLALKNKKMLHLQDEYYDIGLIGLVNGINNYNPSLGIKESTYFYRCISNEINKQIYTENRSKRKCPYQLISLDGTFVENGRELSEVIPDSNINLEEQLIEKEQTQILYNAISHLREDYQNIIKRLFGIGCAKEKLKDIAKEKTVTNNAIINKRKLALKQLKKIIDKGENKMLEKMCVECRKHKNIDEFSIRGTKMRSRICKECEEKENLKQLANNNQKANEEKYKNNMKSQKEILDRLESLKERYAKLHYELELLDKEKETLEWTLNLL